MKYKLDEIKKTEVKRIQDLAEATWPDTFKDILEPKQIRYMLDWMYSLATLAQQIADGHKFFVYQEAGIDLGFIGLESNYEQSKLRIHKIYVRPDTQGKGIGKILINMAKDVIAKDLKQTHLNLNVNKYNDAVSFYEYLGFKTIREEDNDIGESYFMNDFVMELELPSN